MKSLYISRGAPGSYFPAPFSFLSIARHGEATLATRWGQAGRRPTLGITAKSCALQRAEALRPSCHLRGDTLEAWATPLELELRWGAGVVWGLCAGTAIEPVLPAETHPAGHDHGLEA